MNAIRHNNLRAIFLFCLMLSMILSSFANATQILSNGALNNISGPSEDLIVSNGSGGTSTVVNVLTGADISAAPVETPELPNEGNSIDLTEQSILLFSAGVARGHLKITDDSIAVLSGSSAVVGADVLVDGNANIQINNNATVLEDDDEGGEVFIEGNATGTFLGGEVTVFGVGGNATATINGGSVDDDLDAEGDGNLDVIDIFVNDDVDAADNGVMNLMGGVYDEDVEAADSSTINISGGDYIRIIGRGANLISSGGTINVTGGTFSTAGESGGGSIVAAAGGTINMSGATIAGADAGTAATTPIQASLNGAVSVDGVEFNDMEISALTGGRVVLTNVTADNITLDLAAGLSTLDNVVADGFSIAANLGSFVSILSGDLGDGTITAFGGSKVSIVGSNFMVNGIPFAGGEIPFISGDISLTLPGGAQLAATFQRQPGPGDQAATIQLIPEPASLAILGLMAAAITCSRRRTLN